MVAPTPGNVSVSLEYIANLDLYKTEKPYNVLCKPSEHVPTGQESNIQTQWHDDVRIEDVRSYMDHLSFREEGFRYLVHDTKLGTRFDGQDVLDDLEEMTEALRKELGAEKALCYDMRVCLGFPQTCFGGGRLLTRIRYDPRLLQEIASKRLRIDLGR